MALGEFIGNFLQSYSAAKQGKQDREEREKENKARTALFEIELRRAQQQEQQAMQQRMAQKDFFRQASANAYDSELNPMSLTQLLADPAMGLKALQAGIVSPEALAPPKQPNRISELEALLQNPELAALEERLRGAGASKTEINTGIPNVPAGYFRPDPTKPGLIPEPGGPVERERQEAERKAKEAAESAATNMQNVVDTVDEALKLVGPFTTGVASTVKESALARGTPVYDLSAAINTIKANLGVDKIQEMRRNSPTGGALGNTSNIELEGLQSAVASLDQGQSEEAVKRNLNKIKGHYEKWAKAMRDAGKEIDGSRVVDFNQLPP